MTTETETPATRRVLFNVVWSLVATDVALIVLHTLTTFAIFNLDREASVPTWYSSAKLLGVGLLSWLVFRRVGTGRGPWLINAVLFCGLAIDEAVSVHETLSRRVLEHPALAGLRETLTGGDADKTSFAWVLLFLPAMLAVVVFFVFLVRRGLADVPRGRTLFLGGLMLLLVAVGLEAAVLRFPDVIEWGGTEAGRYRLLTTLEESAELFGVTLLFAAVALRIARRPGEHRGQA